MMDHEAATILTFVGCMFLLIIGAVSLITLVVLAGLQIFGVI